MKKTSFQVLNGHSVIKKIYSDKIIRYASAIPLQTRLAKPDATARRRSEFCGSHIEVDIVVKGSEIIEFGQDVDACALGCAAASIVAEYIIGATFDEVMQTQIEMRNMLENGGAEPMGRFAELEILRSVVDYPNRHASTMLVLDAIVAAIEDLNLRGLQMIEQIIAANERIKTAPNAVRETPLEKSLSLSAQTGANIYLKYESMQLTGSFKLRGSTNKLNLLSDAEKAKGIIAASTGNHGLGVATAANLLGIEAAIYVPETASPIKLDAIRQSGGKVEMLKGSSYLAEMTAKSVAEQSGKAYISPYNDFDVICGQGTCGLEIMQQLPDVDAIFIAVGGGGLIGGSGLFAKSVNPNVEIVGCWPQVATSFYEALKVGKVEDIEEGETLSDGTAGGIEHDTITLELCQKVIDSKILVSEVEIADAMRLVVRAERQIIEGAAGVAVAATLKAIKAKPVKYAGKNIAIVICGRNIGFDKFLKAIEE